MEALVALCAEDVISVRAVLARMSDSQPLYVRMRASSSALHPLLANPRP